MTASLTPWEGGGGPTMFGASWLPDAGLGLDLGAVGYREDEYRFSGTADLYRHGDDGRPVVARAGVPFTTRVVVRRPVAADGFSGTVHLEPLHPDADGALTWRALYPYLVRRGHAHVGVAVFAGATALLRDRVDPSRYGALELREDGCGYDVMSQLVRALRDPAEGAALFGRTVDQLYLSGWSATGSFCRIFLNEGFHERSRQADGSPCVDGALVAISSGARTFGYPALSEGSPVVPVGDPRRRIQPAGIPVIELLSEYEAEGSATTTRQDADEAEDRYRLYQVAGSSHSSGPPSPAALVAAAQLERAGVEVGTCQILEDPTDGRLDFVARAVAALLERWARDELPPPRAAPLRRLDDPAAAPKGIAEGALPLERDGDGNAVGGVRTVWVDVPVASYLPHSTPRPGACKGSPFAPVQDPASFADLIGHRRPFSVDVLSARYGNPSRYVAEVSRRADELVAEGWLLAPEAAELVEAARQTRW